MENKGASLKIGSLVADLPIILGGMAVEISMAPLCAAVAEKGGVGLLPASGLRSDRLIDEIRFARRLTDGVIGVNVMLAVRECKELSFSAIEEGIDLLVIGAGFIPKLIGDLVAKAHKHDTPIAMIVSSVKAANLAQRLGVDAVIAEGCEAGGHLGTDRTIWEILPEIVSSVSIPVIAAGGCGTGHGLRETIRLGASGIQMATRFALTRDAQSCVSKAWQEVVLNASSSNIVVLNDRVGSPVKMPLRVVLTPAIERLIRDGVSHVPGHRPWCERGCLRKGHCEYRDSNFTNSFCIFEMLRLAKEGDIENGVFVPGNQAISISGHVDDLPTVAEVIDEVIAEIISVGLS